jgi:peptidoglycan L-alanyl-D-glutamate endopeptidase CwlK
MKVYTWFKNWFARLKAGRKTTSAQSLSPSSNNSRSASLPKSLQPRTNASTPKPTSEAKAATWQADPRSEKNLATVVPELRKIGRELLRRLAAEGLTFKVIQGRRTPEEQAALYAKGRTAPGPKVTWTLRSRHLTGRAIDIALFSGKNVVWESKHYTRAGEIGEELGLVWGGRWKGGKTDRPHFELPTA